MPRELPDRRPARSLLAWLALHDGTHSRSRVAGTLWPAVLESSARASLRTALSSVRRALGPAGEDVVQSTRDTLGLSGAWVDAREFATLVAAGRLEEALALCRGDLLADLDDEWALSAREEHRAQCSELLRRLAEASTDARRRARVVPATRRARPVRRGGAPRADGRARRVRRPRRRARALRALPGSPATRVRRRALRADARAGRVAADERAGGTVAARAPGAPGVRRTRRRARAPAGPVGARADGRMPARPDHRRGGDRQDATHRALRRRGARRRRGGAVRRGGRGRFRALPGVRAGALRPAPDAGRRARARSCGARPAADPGRPPVGRPADAAAAGGADDAAPAGPHARARDVPGPTLAERAATPRAAARRSRRERARRARPRPRSRGDRPLAARDRRQPVPGAAADRAARCASWRPARRGRPARERRVRARPARREQGLTPEAAATALEAALDAGVLVDAADGRTPSCTRSRGTPSRRSCPLRGGRCCTRGSPRRSSPAPRSTRSATSRCSPTTPWRAPPRARRSSRSAPRPPRPPSELTRRRRRCSNAPCGPAPRNAAARCTAPSARRSSAPASANRRARTSPPRPTSPAAPATASCSRSRRWKARAA